MNTRDHLLHLPTTTEFENLEELAMETAGLWPYNYEPNLPHYEKRRAAFPSTHSHRFPPVTLSWSNLK